MKAARPKFLELKPLAAELNRLSDDVTEDLKEAENELSQLNLGLIVEFDRKPLFEGAWGSTDYEPYESQREVIFLGFGPAQNNKWRLLARHYHCYTGEDRDTFWQLQYDRPLLEETRHIRVAASEHIGDLLDEVAKAVKSKIAALKDAKAK